jgi:hypothetical protein
MSQLKVNALVSYSGNTVTLGTSGDTINVASGVTFNTASATVTLPTTIKVNTIQNTNSSTLITQTNSTTITVGVSGQTVALPSQSISYAALSNAVDFRNIVINGDMKIAQRATSVASITTSGYYTLDRFQFAISSLGTWTNSQSTDVPSGYGFANSFKLDCTTADASPAASDLIILNQKFEGQNLQYLKKGTANALPLTLSFWVKSTKTGTFIAELYDTDNTRSISKSYTVSVTNTWEFKTITYAGDTTGALDNNSDNSIQLNFWLGAGTDYTSGALATSWGAVTTANRAVGQVNIADNTANDFLITGVQLEAGEQASGFEFMPIDTNLGRCQRYAFKLGGNIANENSVNGGGYYDANYYSFGWLRSTTSPMRVAPTLVQYGTPTVYGQNTQYTGWTWGLGIQTPTASGWYLTGTKSSHGVPKGQDFFVFFPLTTDYFIFSAEL